MAVITGKIESLKKLKALLNDAGINRFNSVGQINAFLKNFESERKEIPEAARMMLDKELRGIEDLILRALERRKISPIYKLIYYFRLTSLTRKKSKIEINYEKLLSAKSKELYKTLDFTKEVVDGLYTTIAGAIGEYATIQELKKLPNSYYVINDYSLNLVPPIFNKKEGDKILSIQIDHLLICKAGVFILESKNWSNKSIESLDLRSPIKQISRTSYALFILLNSKSKIKLTKHHWGSKRIPIRCIIVMTKGKPKLEYKHVKVLTVNELNNYIQYFDEIFEEEDVNKIFNHLNEKMV